ncbi:MAG TPA: type IV pilus twitching motility protein PilT [Bacillota bacterium]|nr:type IV pilus twitching motility protein PilT [Bacillota bacterium]
MDLFELLETAVKEKASDLHLTVGRPPMIRIFGELVPISGKEILSNNTIVELISPILDENRKQILLRTGQVDFSYGMPKIARFRVNVFRQRGAFSTVMRTIPTEIPLLDSLGVPDVVRSFAEKSRGLVLVTGPTGSGKTTTLAALVDLVNENRNCHILTLEDPIEYLHRHKLSIVNQREVGTDTDSFSSGLRAALREDPDVILVGEMRDLETIQIALTAAETGHLVFATLHTNDVTQTVDRIIDVFPPHQQTQIRMQLALALQGIVAQQLIPRIDRAGRVLATEVLLVTSAARNVIREGKTFQLPTILQTGGKLGMHTLDSRLRMLYDQRVISLQEALLRCSDAEEFKKTMNM